MILTCEILIVRKEESLLFTLIRSTSPYEVGVNQLHQLLAQNL